MVTSDQSEASIEAGDQWQPEPVAWVRLLTEARASQSRRLVAVGGKHPRLHNHYQRRNVSRFINETINFYLYVNASKQRNKYATDVLEF